VKLIRTASFVRRQKDSIVHCEIELCAAPGMPDRYLVNLRQGRMGEEWRETTRTPQPVDLATAEALFHLAVTERMAQGFAAPGEESQALPATRPASVVAASAATPRTTTDADRTLLQRLERGSWKQLTQAQRNRILWRVGERRLRAAVPTLVDLIERGDTMQDYCIAWAIGRCGDAGALDAMRHLSTRSASDAVRRAALHAWLALVGPDARTDHARDIIAAWPDELRGAWEHGDADAILARAATGNGWRSLPLDAWLDQLDQVAQADDFRPLARRLMLAVLRATPLVAGSFRALRHIYKMAEMRADGEIFGLLQRRFETTAHAPQRYVYAHGRYQSFAQEAARPDSTVAYGGPTRHYLLRRGWRTLRRLGQDADPDFIPMALGVLATYDDRDANVRTTGRIVDRYGHWPLFNHLLRERAGLRHSASGLSWYVDGARVADGIRQEAFPELWDRSPEALLWLMRHSHCEGVHAFAARALADNTAYCAALPPDTLRELLRSPYAPSARFAFETARRRFEPGVPDGGWLMLLIQSTLPEALQYALDCIARAPDDYAADAALVLAVLCAPLEAVRRQGWLLCQAALRLPGQPEAIVLRLLDWLDECADLDDAAPHVATVAPDLLRTLEQPLRAAAEQAPYERLVLLLRHRLAPVRALACGWLLLHAAPPSTLPAPLLAALLRDPDAAVRAAGVQLFGRLPDAMLATQVDLVAVFACAPDAGVRRAIGPVIARLAPADRTFAAALLPALLDGLFRGETGEDMHADLLAWVTGPLADAPALADPDLLHRLLAARSKGAQRLGAALIDRFDALQFDVADWAAFGRNQNTAVRRWAYAAFEAHPARARAQLEAALRLFDSRFDDTREFAIRYFGSVCTRDDWTPLLLVSLCDHVDPAAQRFGRAMITTHVDVEDAADFMFKLSQHPSANMQLFVSSWLESASAGDIDRLRRLEPYFLTVLSQVDRGRTAKDRVQDFLARQALLSEDIAAFVAQLFARQVVTVAVKDKARYIEALRAIQQRYPQLPAVMTVRSPAVLPATRSLP
jgi:hypothetical protein